MAAGGGRPGRAQPSRPGHPCRGTEGALPPPAARNTVLAGVGAPGGTSPPPALNAAIPSLVSRRPAPRGAKGYELQPRKNDFGGGTPPNFDLLK